ncbi:FumA C-terminus/TtdB family hydratase beta subunit [Chloroflexi bacterium TSY]|nr:FumA C-terminus/TtdB family hydratase beta subunit [Chloroflexi bacterium TSY]
MHAFYTLSSPLSDKDLNPLKIGDEVRLNGQIFVARDAAHKRMVELLESGKELPFDPVGQILYYMGPTPARPGQPIGSAGPTTSGRVDSYTPLLLAQGIKATIGKGYRSDAVRKAMQKYKAVYFAAIGGTGALISRSILKREVIAWPELGPEALQRLTVENFSCFVANDVRGGDLYIHGKEQFSN